MRWDDDERSTDLDCNGSGNHGHCIYCCVCERCNRDRGKVVQPSGESWGKRFRKALEERGLLHTGEIDMVKQPEPEPEFFQNLAEKPNHAVQNLPEKPKHTDDSTIVLAELPTNIRLFPQRIDGLVRMANMQNIVAYDILERLSDLLDELTNNVASVLSFERAITYRVTPSLDLEDPGAETRDGYPNAIPAQTPETNSRR